MTKRDLTRITINVPTELLQAIDAYAEKYVLTRTTAITILCADAIKRSQSPLT